MATEVEIEEIRKIVKQEIEASLVDLRNDSPLWGGPDYKDSYQDEKDPSHYHFAWYSNKAIKNMEEMLQKICQKLGIDHESPWDEQGFSK